MDECGVSESLARLYRRALKGERVYSPATGQRSKRINIVGAMIHNRPIAATLYELSTNGNWFEVWFEWNLCLELPKGSVIMDNALFHRKERLEAIAKSFGFQIL